MFHDGMAIICDNRQEAEQLMEILEPKSIDGSPEHCQQRLSTTGAQIMRIGLER